MEQVLLFDRKEAAALSALPKINQELTAPFGGAASEVSVETEDLYSAPHQSEWIAKVLQAASRAASDLELARKVQARLFPRKLPRLGTLTYAGVCIPARDLGGDYYDFLDLGRGCLGLAVGDVAGKGIAAALLMANLQANLRSQCALALGDIASLLRSVNRVFHESTPEASYATLFFAEYRDEDQQLRYVNCGHPAALLLHRDGTIARLEATATVLGLDDEWDCATAEVSLFPGDTVLLYTDGITEAQNASGEEFGEQRLVELLRAHRRLPASHLLRAIVGAVERYAGNALQDDVTLVAAHCTSEERLGGRKGPAHELHVPPLGVWARQIPLDRLSIRGRFQRRTCARHQGQIKSCGSKT